MRLSIPDLAGPPGNLEAASGERERRRIAPSPLPASLSFRRSGHQLSAMYGQAQNLHYFPGDQMTPLFGYAALAVIELRLGQKVNPVTTNHCFPIESIRRVQ